MVKKNHDTQEIRLRIKNILEIKVTSVTRTVDDVSKLRKRNINSSANSAHQSGLPTSGLLHRFAPCKNDDSLDVVLNTFVLLHALHRMDA